METTVKTEVKGWHKCTIKKHYNGFYQSYPKNFTNNRHFERWYDKVSKFATIIGVEPCEEPKNIDIKYL